MWVFETASIFDFLQHLRYCIVCCITRTHWLSVE
jgi:hypothetical protein